MVPATVAVVFFLFTGVLMLAPAQTQADSTYRTPSVYVDSGTGCHYLGGNHSSKVSLIPRMNRNGEHMCLSPVTEAR
ncbi:MAG: hypothetical protein COA62_15920 [Rhodobiaceae bacterium]|nr:MAG: hypothetical protein COA62_15920 [Rhodobiaceae bacterium]